MSVVVWYVTTLTWQFDLMKVSSPHAHCQIAPPRVLREDKEGPEKVGHQKTERTVRAKTGKKLKIKKKTIEGLVGPRIPLPSHKATVSHLDRLSMGLRKPGVHTV